MLTEDGLVLRSRAVREVSEDMSRSDLDKLQRTPHDPTGTIRAAERPASSIPLAQLPTPGKGGDKSAAEGEYLSRCGGAPRPVAGVSEASRHSDWGSGV